jgi:hypothetical protein
VARSDGEGLLQQIDYMSLTFVTPATLPPKRCGEHREGGRLGPSFSSDHPRLRLAVLFANSFYTVVEKNKLTTREIRGHFEKIRPRGFESRWIKTFLL